MPTTLAMRRLTELIWFLNIVVVLITACLGLFALNSIYLICVVFLPSSTYLADDCNKCKRNGHLWICDGTATPWPWHYITNFNMPFYHFVIFLIDAVLGIIFYFGRVKKEDASVCEYTGNKNSVKSCSTIASKSRPKNRNQKTKSRPETSQSQTINDTVHKSYEADEGPEQGENMLGYFQLSWAFVYGSIHRFLKRHFKTPDRTNYPCCDTALQCLPPGTLLEIFFIAFVFTVHRDYAGRLAKVPMHRLHHPLSPVYAIFILVIDPLNLITVLVCASSEFENATRLVLQHLPFASMLRDFLIETPKHCGFVPCFIENVLFAEFIPVHMFLYIRRTYKHWNGARLQKQAAKLQCDRKVCKSEKGSAPHAEEQRTIQFDQYFDGFFAHAVLMPLYDRLQNFMVFNATKQTNK